MKLKIRTSARFSASLLCLAAFSSANAAEYLLYDASKFPAKGTVQTKTDTMSMKDCTFVMEGQGRKMEGGMSISGEKVRVATFDSDTQITVEHKKDTETTAMTMMGQAQPPQLKEKEMHGKTVILNKVDGKWAGKLKEGEASEEQAKKITDLAEKFNSATSEAEIYGKKPRKVGDTWDVDPSKLDSFGDDTEDLKGEFKVTFKSIEKFKGEDCAFLVADFNVTGKAGKDNAKLTLKGKANIHRSLKHRVDLQNKIEATVQMNGAVEGTGATMTMTGPMVITMGTEVKLP